MVFAAREKLNCEAGSRRMLAHFTITPRQKGWVEAIDRAIEVNHPDSWKGYRVGENTHKELSNHSYRVGNRQAGFPGSPAFPRFPRI